MYESRPGTTKSAKKKLGYSVAIELLDCVIEWCHGRLPGSDAALLSPVVAPRKGRAAVGTTVLTCARGNIDAHRSRALLFALGGVDATTVKACIDAGAHGVAVVGAVLDGRDPAPLIAALGIAR